MIEYLLLLWVLLGIFFLGFVMGYKFKKYMDEVEK
jgi:hypothetical protein